MGRVASTSQRRIARRTWIGGAAGLWLLPTANALAQVVDEFGSSALRAAGSTFVHPLMAAWAQEYRVFRKGGVNIPVAGGGLDDEAGGVALDYEAVGSQAGIARIRARAVDFAASEMPLPKADLERDALLQVPLVAGAVVVGANLDGLAAREIRLTARLLADIFRGRVKNWSDPLIAQLNRGIALPNAPIAVLHRADGSGTTFMFTQFLSQASAEWKSEIGSDLLVNWPAGAAFKGNAGLAAALERTPNGLAYLGQGQVASRCAVVSLQNPRGQFVAPTAASVQAAVSMGRWDAAAGFNTSLVNSDGDGSYPIVATVFGLLSERSAGFRRRLARAFFEWSLTNGRATAVRLGYTPLPPALVQYVLTSLR